MVVADAVNTVVIAKGLMIGGGFIGPAIGIGLVGSGYVQAAGRNPSAAGSLLGQALIFVALAELFGLLAFASVFIFAK
jgi:F-type H+-transporting ATPase subunit c